MHLKNKRPIFVPREFQDEIEKLSKAALMDLCWDLACTTGNFNTEDEVMAELRKRIDVVVAYRKAVW